MENMNEKRVLNPMKFRAAVFDQMSSEDIGYSNYSYWKSTLRTFFKNKAVLLLVILIAAIIVMSFVYPIASPVDPNEVSLFPLTWNQRPSADHWFGTDTLGRDIWTRAWYGVRNSFILAFCIALSDVGIGMIVGAIWGYNKKLDPIMIEIYNIITNIPSTVYLVLLAYIMNTSYITLFVSMASRGWIVEARFFRNRILSIRDSEYNVASRCLGTRMRRIATKNIIPHIISLIIMEAALCIPYSIGSEVFLGFVGVGLPVDAIPLGSASFLPGKMNAAVIELEIIVRGQSCHGAHPEQDVDAVVAAAHIITALQTINSRMTAPTTPVVVTIGSIEGGTGRNIVTGEVVMQGTVRALDMETAAQVKQQIRSVACGVASAWGAEAEVSLMDDYPALINDRALTMKMADEAAKLLGEENVIFCETPSMGADDFAYFANAAKGCYFNIGAAEPDKPVQALHSETFAPHEDCILTGIALISGGVWKLMEAMR